MKEIIALTAGLLLTVSAYGLTDAEEYQDDLNQASISISKAADIAAKHVSGKTVSVELEGGLGQVYYDTDVLAKNRLFEVRINAKDGKVISVNEDFDD